MHEVEINLFGQQNCRCIVYENPNNNPITIPFQGMLYNNVTVYRPLQEVIPVLLQPRMHQCVKNAFYVGRYFGYNVVEGSILVFNNGDYYIEPHCWNICNEMFLDVTPFEIEPLDIMYFPFRNYEFNRYSDRFGGNTATYTFLSGNQIMQFSNEIRSIMHANDN